MECAEAIAESNMDPLRTDTTLTLLNSQTSDADTRFARDLAFWKTAFVPLLVVPRRVEYPGSGLKGAVRHMLGTGALEFIPSGTLLMVATGFWWPKCVPPPTPPVLGLPSHHGTDSVWGVSMKAAGAENLLFYVNASSPVSLVNDYRGISVTPNSALVSSFPPYTREVVWGTCILCQIEKVQDFFACRLVALDSRSSPNTHPLPLGSNPTRTSSRGKRSLWTTANASGRPMNRIRVTCHWYVTSSFRIHLNKPAILPMLFCVSVRSELKHGQVLGDGRRNSKADL